MSSEFLFGIVPLAAGICLAVILLFKLLVGSRHHDAGAVRARRPRLSVLYVALVGIALGHLLMLAWPAQILAWNRSANRLLTLELTFFLFGLLALGGLIRLVTRDLRDASRYSPGSILGTISQALALVAIVSGLVMAVRYRWASSWASLTLTPWVRSVLRLRPQPQLVETLPYVVKLHVFAGIALVALLPFTGGFRRADAWLGTIGRAVEARLAHALTRWLGPLLDGARHACRGLLSPESDD
jgi:nitrate reductase gamma subunit